MYPWTVALELCAGLAEVTKPAALFASTLLASFHGLLPGGAVMTQLVIAPMNVVAVAADTAALPCVIRLAVPKAA
jgi:hypothetical protein